MTNRLRPSQLEVLNSGDLNGNEFFVVFRLGKNFSLGLGELKKYLGTGGASIQIVQETGDSETLVMSQKAVTEAIRPIVMTQAEYDALPNKVDGQTYYIVD